MSYQRKPPKEDLAITVEQAVTCLPNKGLKVVHTPFGINIHDDKSKKTLSVNIANGKGTYSDTKNKFYYEKAGKNSQGGSWNVVKVEPHMVRMYSAIKEFLSWFFK